MGFRLPSGVPIWNARGKGSPSPVLLYSQLFELVFQIIQIKDKRWQQGKFLNDLWNCAEYEYLDNNKKL